ncbi:unnamed protein product [Cuscuta europaea]|uniref:F-box domain-containing protein n=1 Tax=Cuscuta europaea TaxID=41803 RepID=A0A9P1E1P4_CUSEU|nr:unnamed protein product [Cuscuta europaea]
METTTYLPWDLIVQILCRLPVKDLLRCRCLSKLCCSLINCRDFINLHLQHSPESTSQLGFVFGGNTDLCWAALNDLDSFARLTYPIDIGTGISVHGSCNGLLAIRNRSSDMAIWNPSIRRYISLPISDLAQSIPLDQIEIILTGFGHDPVTDDYKLVVLTGFKEPHRGSSLMEFKVYSVNDRSWKIIDDFPKDVSCLYSNGVLVGNTLYFMVLSRANDAFLILAFDLVSETFRRIQLPENCWCEKLMNLEGSLCAVISPDNFPFVQVWRMKEYGVKESWFMLFNLARIYLFPPFRMPIPLFKNGDQVVLHNCEKILVYDTKIRTLIKREAGSGFPEICDAIVCVKSLVGLHFNEST